MKYISVVLLVAQSTCINTIMFATMETIIYATLVVAVVFLLHRAFVPRSTIPGIPYHHVSRNTFLGDLPRMLAHGKLYPSTWYFHDQCKEHNTPIMQFWIRPFARPWVVVTDGREGYDVMTRRTKTFDRSRELSKSAKILMTFVSLECS